MKLQKIALLLTVLLTVQSCPAFAEETIYLVSESFNGYATNAQPTTMELYGRNARVIDREPGRDKAFFGEAVDGNDAGISISFSPTDGIYTISADICLSGTRAEGGLSIVDGNSTAFAAVKFLADGGLTTSDGHISGGLPMNRYATVAVTVNPADSVYSIYLNNKQIVKNWLVKSGLPKTASKFNLLFASPDTGVLQVQIDNVYVYHGERKTKGYPVSTYNSSVDEFIDETSQVNYQLPVIYVNNDYEDGLKGIVSDAKTNEILLGEEKNGNHFLRINANGTDDALVSVAIMATGSDCIVYEQDFKIVNPALQTDVLVNFIGANGNAVQIITYNEQLQYITDKKGVSLGVAVPGGQWHHFAAILDIKRNVMDIYIDNELVAKKCKFSEDINFVNWVRVSSYGKQDAPHEMWIDNQVVYAAHELLSDEEKSDSLGVISQYGAVRKRVEGHVAFQLQDAILYDGQKKVQMEHGAWEDENGEVWIPVIEVFDKLGVTYIYDQEAQALTTECGFRFGAGDTFLQCGDKQAELAVAPQMKDDILYLPLREWCKATGKVLSDNVLGMVMIGDAEWKEAETVLRVMAQWMLYERPNVSQIKEAYAGREAVHPRIGGATPERVERLKRNYREDAAMKASGERYIVSAQSYFSEPPVKFDRYDGTRILAISRKVMDMTKNLAIAWWLTEDPKIKDRIWQEMEAVCVFPSWNEDVHYLDTAEMAYAVATAYDWLYDAWTPEQKKVMEEALLRFALVSGKEIYEGRHNYDASIAIPNCWVTLESNWNGVCNAGLTAAAVALLDVYPEQAFEILEYAIRSVEANLVAYAPDGAYFEGPAYWNYSLTYLYNMLSTLDDTFGTDFNLSKAQGMSETWKFAIQQADNSRYIANFSDAEYEPILGERLLAWLGQKYNNPSVTALCYQRAGGAGSSFEELMWYDPSFLTEDVNVSLDNFYSDPSKQIVTMRSTYEGMDENWISMQAIGTEKGDGHAHLDAGSYVVTMAGFRVVADLGPDDYNMPKYFTSGGGRENIYRVSPEGHNLFVINPSPNKLGQKLYAMDCIEKFESKERGAIAVADLSKSYAENASSARRGICMADDRNSIIVRDEIKLLKPNNTVWWGVHTQGSIEILDNNTAIIEKNGAKVKAQFITNAKSFALMDMEPAPIEGSHTIPGNYKNDAYRRLTAKLETASDDLYMAVRYTPLNNPYADKPLENTAIDEWSIPDGRLAEAPVLESLSVDGQQLASFTPRVTAYQQQLAYYDGITPPTVTAEAGNHQVEVVQTDSFDDLVLIKVTDAENQYLTRTYRVAFSLLADFVGDTTVTAAPTGVSVLPVESVTATDIPEPENSPDKTIDGNTESRWASNVDGTKLIADLGSEKSIRAVGIQAALGSARSTMFELEISVDGKTWIKVFDGQTSGATNDMEYCDVGGYTARYVRLIGHGNNSATSTDWTTILEWKIFGN